MYMRVQPE